MQSDDGFPQAVTTNQDRAASIRAAGPRIGVMGPELGELALEIVRWVEDYQPGIVASELVDADGRRHTFVGKVPIFSTEDNLDAKSGYPRRGGLRCTVLSRWKDANGRDLVRVSIAEPTPRCLRKD